MRAGCCSRLRRIAVALTFAVFAFCMIYGSSTAFAAAIPAEKYLQEDPYDGTGIKLPNGGGEPGRAYKAYMNAIHRKDKRQLCKLTGAKPAEMQECMGQQSLDGIIALYGPIKSEKVMGGFMKGDDAKLNVIYTPHEGPVGNEFVVMRKANNIWTIAFTGGSGSTTISAEVSATVADGSITASSRVAQSQEPVYTGPLLGKWTFQGRDNNDVDWSGTLTIKDGDRPGSFWCSLDVQSSTTGRGVEQDCSWDPAKRQFSIGSGPETSYTATVAADRKSMTQGSWANGNRDGDTGKVAVTETGEWTAEYQAGQGDPEPASASGTAPAAGDPEFARILVTPNKREFSGKCPASIAFTADITFKTPLPQKFSYRWEQSTGKKTRDKVVKPPRTGHMSVREVWRGGKPGEQLEASVRFVAEADGAMMILDPPGVKVKCK